MSLISPAVHSPTHGLAGGFIVGEWHFVVSGDFVAIGISALLPAAREQCAAATRCIADTKACQARGQCVSCRRARLAFLSALSRFAAGCLVVGALMLRS